MERKTRKPTRCDYCYKPAVTWIRYTGHISKQTNPLAGGNRTLYVSACVEHSNCVNFTAHQSMQDAAIINT